MEEVQASVITIGDELLIGQTIDTNSAYIARAFNAVGIWVNHRVAVGDDFASIWNALDAASARASIVIITGGLGPTADDITKPLLCEYFGGRLVLDREVLKHIENLFENVFRHKTPLLQRNIMQAEVPDNCTVLHNEKGTAPGMWFEKNAENGQKTIFISLPGVPHEMEWLLEHQVIPRLKEQFSLSAIAHRTAVTFGMGESSVAERLQDFENSLPAHISLAYLPAFGMVKLRLTGRGKNPMILQSELSEYFSQLKNEVAEIMICDQDKPIEKIVGELLTASGKTLATAESCTGGYIAHLITKIPGASAWFRGGIVAYHNDIKQEILGVEHAVLQSPGAVSKETVTQMARGVAAKLNAGYGLATSGIMGPNGGTPEKPVGTVWMAVSDGVKTETRLLHLRFERRKNIETAAVQALNFLRKFIADNR